MRRILTFVLLACLLTPGVRAQTADQLNKLSLEALTAPPPRGSGGGYAPSARHRPAWLPRPASRASHHYQPRFRAQRYPAHRYQARRYQAPRARYAAPYRAPRPGPWPSHSMLGSYRR